MQMIEKSIRLDEIGDHVRKAFKDGTARKIVICPTEGENGSVIRFLICDGHPVTWNERTVNAVEPPKPEKPPYVLETLERMEEADRAYQAANSVWKTAQDELSAKGRRLHLNSRTDPELAEERAKIEAAFADREEASEIQLEKRKAHQQAMDKWRTERDLAQLQARRKQLEEAKAAELQKRYRILKPSIDRLKAKLSK